MRHGKNNSKREAHSNTSLSQETRKIPNKQSYSTDEGIRMRRIGPGSFIGKFYQTFKLNVSSLPFQKLKRALAGTVD